MKTFRVLVAFSAIYISCPIDFGHAADKTSATSPIKVFVLAGDENVLEQGLVNGRTVGVHQDFYPNATAVKDEKKRHVHCAVYKGAYNSKADYDTLKPEAEGLVEVGDPLTVRASPKSRGQVPVPMTPFPELALKEGHTTVLRGFVSVAKPGRYELHPGAGDTACNVTTVDGKEVYRLEPGQKSAVVTAMALEPNKRYAFKTSFFGRPGHELRLPWINLPGALTTVVAEHPKYSFLKGKDGEWVERSDVVLYDAHPIHNNTEAPARPLRVVTKIVNGPEGGDMMGVDLMLGHRLGDALEEPVMLLRFATKHDIWFYRGSRDLGHDYLPPSSGGAPNLDGEWDVIHFNFGVWDATYRDASSKYFSGHNITSVEDFEKNLRTLVAKMKKTGATIIWGTVTPIWEGEPGRLNGDEDAYNRVAEKVMKENGVIINDLNAESRRQGFPKTRDVHSVGGLGTVTTQAILAALKDRKTMTKPIPRVLLMGDSITGSYQGQVMNDLDGKAKVFKNPGNAEDTWNGLERMDEWLDLKRYLLNGQEYMELVDGIRKAIGDEFARVLPGQAGRGVQLAGMVWFQGTADTQSTSMAAGYEAHLVHLIKDLRKDLNAPKLPFVVAALASAQDTMAPHQQKVFDAQMAVGNTKAHPEFEGNVISIDTRPMRRPLEQSPGGRDAYKGNAETYLEIGDAMGKAMLKLLENPSDNDGVAGRSIPVLQNQVHADMRDAEKFSGNTCPDVTVGWLDQYNVCWKSQSTNSGASMPVSGGDIGLNVWVENDQILFYLARAGSRDENGALLKLGRVRLTISPNPFAGATFRQELKLRDGSVEISTAKPDGEATRVKIWIEVHRPVVHFDVTSSRQVSVDAAYESWRSKDIELPNDKIPFSSRAMCQLNYGRYQGKVFLRRDIIRTLPGQLRFHHKVDNEKDCFAFQVKQQGLTAVRDKLKNPLLNLTWGGALVGEGFVFTGEAQGEYAGCPYKQWTCRSAKAAGSHRLRVCLHTANCAELSDWDTALDTLIASPAAADAEAWQRNCRWWTQFWNRSRLVINTGRGEADVGWRLGRNYQLFRYMLACNAYGREATLFNGGLFTFDPVFVNGRKGPGYTPDHRQWGAGLTAQNQRMLVWPLLKTGDFDLVETGLRFYTNGLQNATARVRHYWNHEGCCFTEQTTITALPGSAVYGFHEVGARHRPPDLEPGVQLNPAVSYIYESQLEYAWLMLRLHTFSGVDIRPYLPFIEQSVIFYDEHYRFRCKQRTGRELDPDGKLVIAPSNTLESHPNAINPTSVIAALQRLLGELQALPVSLFSRENAARWERMRAALPAMPTAENPSLGGTYLKPAENYAHSSWHCPEMYPLYPYELFGIGLPNLDMMKRTSLATGDDRQKTAAWLQGNIHAARLGDTALAKDLNAKKMENGPYRFPAFWPHDVDWAPDHNWGGSGMIGLQEMLMQTHSLPGEIGRIRLFPAWPDDWDVDFKLHAPHQTTVEGSCRAGQSVKMSVTPEERRKDIIDMRGQRLSAKSVSSL